MHHILVVDDDEEITALLTQYLTRFGYATYAACDGDSMRAQLAAQPIDLVVLDVMLPGVDGIRLAKELRSRSQLPIIMLTARANPFDCVLGLELGANDYMGKPFEPRELVARIQNVLRNSAAAAAAAIRPVTLPPDLLEVVQFDGWQLYTMERHLVSPDGVVVPLSGAELRLLCTFLRTPRRVCSRDKLMEQAHGRTMAAFERSIDLLVSRLRSKLGDDPRSPVLLKTVRGVGYVLEVQNVQGQPVWQR
ncbi:response regulator transcription factor [Comamonas sp. 17RB]|uniref:response regulator n=1 Tax=Comamonas sp. 17RB TaxID=3047025 RepID=UPI0024B7EF6C|nr:response regulator transcription factor [Comamonas sp. 17RB]MDI9857061.1 response regulator transcription factor [Comamonas sp. 17RB]